MTLNIHRLIAAIEPDLYCAPEARKAVKEVLRHSRDGNEVEVLRKAAELALPQPTSAEDLQHLSELDPYQLLRFECPLIRHTLVHDALGDSVERIYFRLLELLRQNGWEVAKLVDAVHASAASGLAPHLAEQAIRRQEHIRRLLQDVHQNVDRICQLQEELRQRRDTLGVTASGGSAPTTMGEGIQSILASPLQLRDETAGGSQAGETDRPDSTPVGSTEHGASQGKLDRLQAELHREEAKLQMYARWIAPLLPPPITPSIDGTQSPDAIAGFDTALLNVVLLAVGTNVIQEGLDSGQIPASLRRHAGQAALPIIVAEFNARTIPDQHPSRGFTHRGRVEITLTGYALTPHQISQLRRFFDHDALATLLQAMLPTEPELVRRILVDLDRSPDGPGTPSVRNPHTDPDPNPFAVLFSALRDLIVRLRELFTGLRFASSREQALQRYAALLSSLCCRKLQEALTRWLTGP